MVALLLPHVVDRPDTTALADLTGQTPWAVLNTQANRWVGVLRRRGIEPGDRVAVMTGNRREAWEVYLAGLHAGWVLVLIPWDAPADRVSYMLRHSGAQALVVEEATRSVAAEAAATLDLLVWSLDGVTGDDGVRSSAEALSAVPSAEPDRQITGGPMFYTSGTTGMPKGVVSAGVASAGASMDTLAAAVAGVVNGLGMEPSGRAMIVGPGYHSGQFVLSTYPLLAGQSLMIRRGPDPAEILRTIDACEVTNCLLLPADLAALLRMPDEARRAFSGASLKLLLHGGAPCPQVVRQGMIDWLGGVVTEYYGATEGGLFALSTADDFVSRPGSVGRVLPINDCRVLDADGADVPAGEDGAIYLRPRSGARFNYHDDPDKTAEAYLDDGWFTVGDVGRLDEEGYLYVSGRASHMIMVDGTWVHPGQVEAMAVEHDAVTDAGAFFVDDELHLAVVATDGADRDTVRAGLTELLATRLGPSSVPRAVYFLNDIPRSAAGKILRPELQAAAFAGRDAGQRTS